MHRLWKTQSFIISLMLLLPCRPLLSAAEEAASTDQRTRELQSLHWGMFVCWSFSTFSGREWTPGIEDVSFFRATGCDTDQWARTAKEAEMGYILFLAKHHDGFCLWDTQTTDRKVTNTPLGRDVLRELRESCDRHGIKLALYFSEGDWSWPGAKDGQSRGSGQNADMERQQLTELLTDYGPIEYLWIDHAAGTGGLDHAQLFRHCKSLQPGCFVGFNHGDQSDADIRIGEMGRPGPLSDHRAAGPHMRNTAGQNYCLAEFTYPILPPHQGGAMWFYSLPEHDQLCHPAEKLYADYRGAVKYGNLFSIDIGPNYEGRLRDIDVQTLRAVGQMIRNPPPVPISEKQTTTASSCWGEGYESHQAVDGDTTSRWGGSPQSRQGWLEIQLPNKACIDRATVMEIAYPRTQAFTIDYHDGQTWLTIVSGSTINGRKTFSFPPVTATTFRLNITKANEVPTIEEFQLFECAD